MRTMDKNAPIRIISETPIAQIWSYLSLWESETAARRLIDERAARAGVTADDDRFADKARGVAYCLRNARECLCLDEQAWIPRLVAKYYGTMWLLSGIMIADPASEWTLSALERTTKMGHGLANIVDAEAAFPASELVFLRESGFFPSYLKFAGWTKAELASGRPTNQRATDPALLSPEDRVLCFSLDDLFRRLPELSGYYAEVTGRRSLTAHVFMATRSTAEKAERDAKAMISRGAAPPHPGYTWIGIGASSNMTRDDVDALRMPVTDWELHQDEFDGGYWQGKFTHDPASYWHQQLSLHSSAMAGTSWIAPFMQRPLDYLAQNFMLLYGLSILTRYRPRTWREVVEGNLDTYRPLIALYIQVVDRVVPQLALEAVSARQVTTAQPGSLFAPV